MRNGTTYKELLREIRELGEGGFSGGFKAVWNADKHADKGFAYYAEEQWEEAARELLKAFKGGRRDSKVLGMLGNIFWRMSRTIEGEERRDMTQTTAYFYRWAYEAAFKKNRFDIEWMTWHDKMHYVAETYEREKAAGLYS